MAKPKQEDQKNELAKKLGYGSLDDAIINLYKLYKSTRQVGRLLNMTGPGVKYRLRVNGEHIYKRGGNNNPTGIGLWHNPKGGKDN